MKEIKFLFIFSLLMFIPHLVNAECDFKEKGKLQSLASNLNFTYNYKQKDDDENFPGIEFSVTVANLRPELYIVDLNTKKTYYYNENKEVTIDGYSDGISVRFAVYANSGNCKDQHLITNYVSLPSYNRYHIDKVCEDVTGYQLCNRWSRVTLSYDTFVKKVTNYKKSLPEDTIDDVVVQDDFVEKIIDFLSNYSFYLFGGIIVVCSGLIYYLDKKDSLI